jgi:hypothetical protein
LRVAVEEGKSLEKTLPVYVEIFYEMPACRCPGSTAALKDGFFVVIATGHPVILEKGNRQERDLLQGVHLPGLNAEQLAVVPV